MFCDPMSWSSSVARTIRNLSQDLATPGPSAEAVHIILSIQSTQRSRKSLCHGSQAMVIYKYLTTRTMYTVLLTRRNTSRVGFLIVVNIVFGKVGTRYKVTDEYLYIGPGNEANFTVAGCWSARGLCTCYYMSMVKQFGTTKHVAVEV